MSDEARIVSVQLLVCSKCRRLKSLRFLGLSREVGRAHLNGPLKAFLEAHGSKPTELDTSAEVLKVNLFKVCPNLASIILHLSMARTTLPFMTKTLHGKWDKFFGAFEPKRFPNLREIEVALYEWPTTE
ncbi:hypothetical protein C8R44DRAFT_737899 [Mycena epipterygia]|nr:hypothetical protein C8R44DRAFT_737899 [Mycena epipterygia]